MVQYGQEVRKMLQNYDGYIGRWNTSADEVHRQAIYLVRRGISTGNSRELSQSDTIPHQTRYPDRQLQGSIPIWHNTSTDEVAALRRYRVRSTRENRGEILRKRFRRLYTGINKDVMPLTSRRVSVTTFMGLSHPNPCPILL